MGEEYEEIEKVETKISEWLKGVFLKERLLFAGMLELILESFKPLGGRRKDTAEGELALATLATRMFNDAEGAKQLLLWGLPDQAQPLIRDIIECMLLFRLFLQKPKTAKKWLINLAEYQPGAVNAKLLELGVHAKEYAWYGLLSHGGIPISLLLCHIPKKWMLENKECCANSILGVQGLQKRNIVFSRVS